jgi:peroxiredoxin
LPGASGGIRSNLDNREENPMTALKPGAQAPEFSLVTNPDQKIILSDLRGRPDVLVFYPADWSSVCSDQLALYNELNLEKFGNDIKQGVVEKRIKEDR